MCWGLSGNLSIFLRSFTMKLSTVRFVDDVSRPQIRERILVATDGLGRALGEHPQELHFVERQRVLLAAGGHGLRRQVDLRIPELEHLGSRGRRRRDAPKIARMRAMSSLTLNGLVT